MIKEDFEAGTACAFTSLVETKHFGDYSNAAEDQALNALVNSVRIPGDAPASRFKKFSKIFYYNDTNSYETVIGWMNEAAQ